MKRALDSVNERILAAVKRRQPDLIVSCQIPRLVAVSKLKPVSAILEAYEYGQRYFGENYIQELEDKSNNPEIIEKCPDIKFHFIGHLQSNKANKLLRVKNLHMIETVDSIKLADLINRAFDRHNSAEEKQSEEQNSRASYDEIDRRLKVLIQVNTSGEEQKNGIKIEDAPDLADHIYQECKWLQFAGVMTIGKLEGWGEGPNLDFLRLSNVRETIGRRLSIEPASLELSMGMSGDFEDAITLGSTNIRVGTAIFGERSQR